MTVLTRPVMASLDPGAPPRLLVDAPYRVKPHLDALRAKWDQSSRRFTLPLTWANCLGLRTELGSDLSLDPELTLWAASVRKHADMLTRYRIAYGRSVGLPALPGMDNLYPHQRSGIDLIRLSQEFHRAIGDGYGARYLVLDETGVGKTAVALGALHVLDDALPAVVLCPKSVIRPWAEYARKFFPHCDIREVHGSLAQRRKALIPGAHLYVMSYESLRSHSRILPYPSAPKLTDEQRQPKELQTLGVRTLIVDEVHRCASSKTLQTRAAWAVADDAHHVIAMTGTPIQESPEDLWPVLRMLDRSTFGTVTAFRDRWLDMVPNPFGGWDVRGLKTTTGEEFHAILATMSRRAEKATVLPFLPPKVHEIRWVELPPALRRTYEQMRKDYLAELGSGTTVADNAMVVAGRLVQLANAPLDVIQNPDGSPTVRMVNPSPKVRAFMEDVAAGDFTGTSVVVFSDSRQLLDLTAEAMATAGIDHVSITGDSSAEDRAAAIERFQRGDVQYILISRAGDTGITLTAASVMVRLTRAWSYITHTQAADRVHRIGSEQHESILYIDYISAGTIEEGQIVRLNSKHEQATAILHHDELKELIK